MTNTVLNQRYQIQEEIGNGGMSIVYKALDFETSQEVAVKVLRSELSGDEQVIKKFNQEAVAAMRLSHPNIVRTRDVGNDAGVHFIVRDLIEGCTLKEYIDQNGALEPMQAAKIAYKIALGLQHAHSGGVIHRDIKPHNIIIGTDDSVKITDFGIAHIVSDATRTTEFGDTMVGTVFYTSPEQVRGLSVDERTDIYSLGVVLFEMVTGTLPFDGENAVNIAMQHVTKEADSAKKYNKSVNTSLDNIIKNAMAKKFENRYRSIDEMIRDLQKYMSGENPQIYLLGTNKKSAAVFEDTPKDTAIELARARRKQKKKAHKLNMLLGNIILVVMLAGLLVLLIYGIITVGSTIFKNNFEVWEVEVPDISQKYSDDAKILLENRQLIYRETSAQYSSTIPAGYVISQKPAAGEIVDEDTLIEVVVSLGAFEIDIPNCVGKDLMTAEYELRSNGYIVVGKYNYVNSDLPENTIVKQSIPAGKHSLDGSYVTMIFDVSSGPADDTVILKSYVGYTEQTLKEIASNITVRITYEYSETVGKDIVMSQDKPAGTKLKVGDVVNFVVSLGPSKVIKKALVVDLPPTVEISKDNTVYVTVQQLQGTTFVTVFRGDVEVIDSQISIDFEDSGTKTYYISVNTEFLASKTIVFE